jgi:hypothetical protein
MRRNFSGQMAADPFQESYEGFNFAQPAAEWRDAAWRGVRIFGADQTPRRFEGCNLKNVEVPPDSTVVDCLTVLTEKVAVTENVYEIGGERRAELVHENQYRGRLNPDTLLYEYPDAPDEPVIRTELVADEPAIEPEPKRGIVGWFKSLIGGGV